MNENSMSVGMKVEPLHAKFKANIGASIYTKEYSTLSMLNVM